MADVNIKKEAQKTMWRLILTYFAYLGTLLIWIGILGMSLMAFDTGFNWLGAFFVLVIASYLPAVIWAGIVSWRKYKTKDFNGSRKVALYPFIYPVIFWLIIRFV